MLRTICIGHLGSDAEVKQANGREFTTFRVAHTDKWTDEGGVPHEVTTWVDCIMNGRQKVAEYLKKGQQVYVSGSVSLRVYSSAKDHCMKAGLTINVQSIELLGGKSDDVPSILYRTTDNKEVRVDKFYHSLALSRGDTEVEWLPLVSRTGQQFVADRNGWIQPFKEQAE